MKKFFKKNRHSICFRTIFLFLLTISELKAIVDWRPAEMRQLLFILASIYFFCFQSNLDQTWCDCITH